MLAEALRFIRVFHDLKQSEAAARLGVSKSYLSEIEGGIKTPTLPLIEKYSHEFDIPMSSIMFFAESLDSAKPSPREQARTFVASKVLTMMKFIEERSDRGHGD
jgi:transcriptional regulator with XRE-family HTH domain